MEINLACIVIFSFVIIFILNRIECRNDIRIMEAQMMANKDLIREVQRENTAVMSALDKSILSMIKDLQATVSHIKESRNKLPP
jgi:signal transduction histidine kinase